MWKRITSFCFSLLFCTTMVFAQQGITVTGTVSDNSGSLPGVNVTVKGTFTGVTTDVNGKYQITVPNADAVLAFSFVGYQTTEMIVGAQRIIDVLLTEDAQQIGEVVVVGYGSQKKVNLTGAVASVDVSKTLDGRAIADAGQGLQGTTPGLSIFFPSAEVGNDPTIRIRGQFASFQGTSNPLILLDNVEIPSLSLVNPDDIESISVLKDASSTSIYGAKGAFGVILIATKKGAKTETTNISYSGNVSWQNMAKKYEMGAYEAMEYAWVAARNLDAGATVVGAFYLVNDDVLARAREWQNKYGGKLGPNDPTVYGRDWYSNGSQKYGLRTYDPYEYLVKKWAPTTNHNLSISGRSGKTTYNMGLNYLDQSGMNKAAKEDKFTRYTGSLRLKTELNKHVAITGGAMYSTREKTYPFHATSNLDQWYYVYRWGPQYPLGKDENDNWIRSPHAEFANANTGSFGWNYTSFNVGTEITITDNWKFNFDYSHANTEYRQRLLGTRFTAADSWGAPAIRNDASGNPIYVDKDGNVVSSSANGAMRAYDLSYYTYTSTSGAPNQMRTNTSNTKQNTFNAYTTYDLTVANDHAFKFMAGINRVTWDMTNEYGYIEGLVDLDNPQYAFAVGQQYSGGGFSWRSTLGYFGRINYVYKNRYLLEGNIRYDGSSKFPTDLRWRLFPSFSAGWVVSEEAFMEGLNQHLGLLKIRGSFGMIGDETVPGSLYISTLGTGNESWVDAGGTQMRYVTYPSAVASDITWQDIQTINFGLDARALNNKIGVTFDWFQRDTKNMIVGNETATTTYGIGAPLGNYGDLRTRGWEISLDFNHRFSNGIRINAMAMLSDAITKITKIGTSRVVTGNYNGKTYGEIWGYRTDRLYQWDDFDLDASGNLQLITLDQSHGPLNNGLRAYKLKGNNPVYQANLQSGNFRFAPGDVKFKDIDGDGEISTRTRSKSEDKDNPVPGNTVENPGDRVVIGNTTPRYEYGFRVGADYRGFDFSIFFQGVGKRNMWGSSALTLPGFNSADGAIAKVFCTDSWRDEMKDADGRIVTPANHNAFYPRPINMGNEIDALNMRIQDRYLLNMAYLRLKNITLGYTVPSEMLKKFWIQKARIYIAAENLYTWDHLNGLPIDPEIIPGVSQFFATSAGMDNYQAGRGGVGIPAFKNVSVGIQLNF